MNTHLGLDLWVGAVTSGGVTGADAEPIAWTRCSTLTQITFSRICKRCVHLHELRQGKVHLFAIGYNVSISSGSKDRKSNAQCESHLLQSC